MKVAISHDWLNQAGGAERVLMELSAMFPEAPVYTSVHLPERLPAEMHGLDVRTSFLQRIPFAPKWHQPLFPLMPMAFEQFDLREYDLVITSSSACAKGVLTAPETLHLCYCHTPARYLWDLYQEYTRRLGLMRPLAAPIAHWMRTWDVVSSQRVDHFIANSHEVARRVRRHYGREAEVIPPPVDTEFFRPAGAPAEDFYLVVSRLVAYKRIDLAIDAANLLKRRLIIVGEGPERDRLERLAGPTIEFRGWRSNSEIAELYTRCRALLFPGFEDFGITPVEAQAAGRPVIAFGRGGVLDTVVPGATGLFFDEQTAAALARAITAFEQLRWDPARCRRNAEGFSRDLFHSRMSQAIERQLDRARSVEKPRRSGTDYLELA